MPNSLTKIKTTSWNRFSNKMKVKQIIKIIILMYMENNKINKVYKTLKKSIMINKTNK